MTRASALLLAVLLLSLPVRAGWESLEGDPAPEPEITSWIAAPEGTTLAELDGLTVLLVFRGPADQGEKSGIWSLNDLRAAYYEDGLRVVSVVPEAPEDPAKYLDTNEIEFSVAVGDAGPYGDGATPRAVVVGPGGRVRWEGDLGDLDETEIANQVRRSRGVDLEKVDAAAVLAVWQREAKRAIALGNHAQAKACLSWIVKHFPDTDASRAADERLAAMKKDREIDRELDAAAKYAKVRTDYRRAAGSERRLESVAKKLDQLIEKYGGTKSAARAERILYEIRSDPAIAAIRDFIEKERVDSSKPNWKTSLPKPPQVAFTKGRSYFWILETNQGDMKLRLFPDVAPMHVSSTIYLTELGFFDGLTFHRVIPGFMAQGGCPLGTGTGSPGYKFDGEFDENVKHDRAGILSTANSGPGTDGSQFFITYRPTAHLDGKHTIFGELVSGMETLKKIEKFGSESGATRSKIVIEKATIEVE